MSKAKVKLVALNGRVEVTMNTGNAVYVSVLLPGSARRMAKQLIQMAELAEQTEHLEDLDEAIIIGFPK